MNATFTSTCQASRHQMPTTPRKATTELSRLTGRRDAADPLGPNWQGAWRSHLMGGKPVGRKWSSPQSPPPHRSYYTQLHHFDHDLTGVTSSKGPSGRITPYCSVGTAPLP